MDVAKAFEIAVRWVMRDTTYHAQYVSTVERQHDDGTLDLTPDDERVRGNGLSNVPIRHGLPGVDVRVVVGSRVLLGFENGDPQRPYANCWERGSIESVSFDGGTAPIARVGDPVTVFYPPSCPLVGTLGGAPFVGTVTIASPGAGVIASGAPRVRA